MVCNKKKKKTVFIKRKWNHVVFSRATILSFHPVIEESVGVMKFCHSVSLFSLVFFFFWLIVIGFGFRYLIPLFFFLSPLNSLSSVSVEGCK